MTWILQPPRNKTAITYADPKTGLHVYEQRLKTPLWKADNTPVNITPTRVITTGFDGWTFDQSDLRIGIGSRNGLGDGWQGVETAGVRLWLRPERLIWWHNPSETFQGIAANPTYVRSNLTATPQTVVVGPDGGQGEINVGMSYTWRGLWTTPGGGELYLKWSQDGQRLKSEPIINAAGRAWVAASAMPTNGAWLPADTYLTFAYRLDVTEVPKWATAGVVKALTGNAIDEAAGRIECRTSTGALAMYMPVDKCWASSDPMITAPLYKRIVNFSGVWYLLIGAKRTDLAGLPAGDLVFDPTLALQPDAAVGEDAQISPTAADTNYGTEEYLQIGHWANDSRLWRYLVRFNLATLPDDAVLTTATLSLYCLQDRSLNARTFRVFRQKRAWVEAQATWNIYSTGVSWSTAGGFGADDCEQTDIGSRDFTATEAVDEFKNWSLAPVTKAGLDLGSGWLVKADTEASDAYLFYTSDHATASLRPKLVVVYTVPGGGGGGAMTLLGVG